MIVIDFPHQIRLDIWKHAIQNLDFRWREDLQYLSALKYDHKVILDSYVSGQVAKVLAALALKH